MSWRASGVTNSQAGSSGSPERMVFDKASAAASVEEPRIKLEEMDRETNQLEAALADQGAEARGRTEAELARLRKRRERLAAVIQG